MRKFYLIAIAILFISLHTAAQNYTWVGGATGDYQDPNNWTPARTGPGAGDNLIFNPASAIVVTNVANQSIASIQIASGTSSVSFATNSPANVLTLTAATPIIYTTAGSILAADFLTFRLAATASLTLNTGNYLGIADGTGGKINIIGNVTISGGTLDCDVNGSGGTTINGSVTYNSGTFSCINASSITWLSGSNYYHAANGSFASAIPAATWNTGSTCNVTGMNTGSIAPTGFANIFFANFNWNCANQTGNVSLLPAGSIVFINGVFTVTSTGVSGTNQLQLSGTGKAYVTAGSYTQTGGFVTLQASTDTTTLSVTAGFNQSGGTMNGVGLAGSGVGILDLKGNVTKSSTWQSNSTSTSSQFIVQFSGAAGQTVNVLSGSWNPPAAGRTNIVNVNTDLVNGIALTGVLRVNNANSATLPATFTMSGIINGGSGGVAYGGTGTGGTTLIYTGGFAQTATAIEFPTSNAPLNLTINNSLGVTFPASFNRTVLGTLSLLNGNLALVTNTLSLTNTTLANQLIYTSGFITTGTLSRYFPTTGLPTSPTVASLFPFGTGINNRGLSLFFSTGTLTSGMPGMVSVTHTPSVNITSISLVDNGVTLDKRTNTNWTINTGAFDMGTGTTASLSAVAANVGSVDVIGTLRLTDAATMNYGNLIPTTGTTNIPVVGKSGLAMADIMSKTLYIGSDAQNQLIIITFNWTGKGATSDWRDFGNWAGTGAVGYPSASTEVAIITDVTAPLQPTIPSSVNISTYQLTVGTGMILTMAPSSVLSVYDAVNYTGTAVFDSSSTFGYASSNAAQNILDLPYGSLSLSGTAQKTFPPSVTVTGSYLLSGYSPIIGTGTFTYAGTGGQRITAANYYNLTIKNDRATKTIALGNSTSNNTIDVKNTFDVSTLTNYVSNPYYNFFNFSAPAAGQVIPGFYYAIITTSNFNKVLDPLGSTVPSHVIYTRSLNRGLPLYTVTGSKVNLYVNAPTSDVIYTGDLYNDLTVSGDAKGFAVDFFNNATLTIGGAFNFAITNYKQTTNVYTTVFSGTGNQTIPAFKTNAPANTPSYKFSNVTINGGSRIVKLAGSNTDTIGVKGNLIFTAFSGAGNGFIVDSSTVSFSIGSSTIPALTPVSGVKNYNNLDIKGGTHNLAATPMTVGGNLSVSGVDTLVGILNVGDGSTARIFNVLGNMSIGGSGTGSLATGQVDMNTNTNGSTKINLGGNLSITGNGQLLGTTTTGTNNGVLIFNGTAPQTYSNTSTTFKNGLVNFNVGDGVTTGTKLTLLNSLNMPRSATAANIGTLTVLANDSLDCSTFNIISNTTYGTAGNAKFNLNAGATLITSNTGGVEGTATSASTGSIINDATMVRTYDDLASYVFNANTSTPFSAASAISKMANLTIGAPSVNLDKSIEISNTLYFKSAAAINLSSFNINLKSSAAGTAKIAPVPDNAAIFYGGTGRFVIERYYTARRAWRLMTAPVTVDAAKTVFNSWQLGGINPVSGSGTFVTGPGANPATNGLDVSPENNYSLKLGTALTPVSNTFGQLISGTAGTAGTPDNLGMFLFVRGDRSSPTLYNVYYANTTTLRDTGKVQIHSETFTATPTANAFTLIGNPYASPVDFNLAAGSNLVRRFYVWDPYLNSSVGGYIVFEDLANTGTYTPTPASPGHMTQILQSSQAFFVQTAASTAASLVFSEPNKSTVYNTSAFRPMNPDKSFKSNLYLHESSDSNILADGNLVQFDDKFSNKVTTEDALKFGNVYEMLALRRDGQNLAVERRPDIVDTDTLFLQLTRTKQRDYQFQFEPTNMDVSKNAFLVDSYTNSQTPVSLTSPTSINFTINADAKSAATDRFMIVFKEAAAAPLPLSYKSIKAYQQNTAIAVEWSVTNETNISRYDVEKSTDGVNFTKIGTVTAKGATTGTSSYSLPDVHPETGNNFYRIASYTQTGAFEYSNVVVVKIGKTATGISIYPNPVTGSTIGLALNNMAAGNYSIRLLNTLGQILMDKQLVHAAGSSMETLKPASKLSAGIYQLEVTAPDNRISTVKVIVP